MPRLILRTEIRAAMVLPSVTVEAAPSKTSLPTSHPAGCPSSPFEHCGPTCRSGPTSSWARRIVRSPMSRSSRLAGDYVPTHEDRKAARPQVRRLRRIGEPRDDAFAIRTHQGGRHRCRRPHRSGRRSSKKGCQRAAARRLPVANPGATGALTPDGGAAAGSLQQRSLVGRPGVSGSPRIASRSALSRW